MGRVLLYPLLGLLGLILLAGTLLAVTLLIENAWRAHAIRRARWEMFAEPTDAGRIKVGVRLIARWGWSGHQEHVIRRDTETEQVNAEDFVELAIAKANALNRAAAYNSAGQQ